MEIIDLNGYAVEEKMEIAKRHLIPKQKDAHGLKEVALKLNDTVIREVIENYTRESGVRELDRQLASIMRSQAKDFAINGKLKSGLRITDVQRILGKPRYSNELYKNTPLPGIAVGLAWTYVGGDI